MRKSRLSDIGDVRREDIMRFLKKFKAEKGYSPSYQQIADAVGIKSPSNVQYHIKILREEGRIMMDDYISRSISIVED